MKLKTRFLVVGMLLVVLSMVMATQYVTTELGYSYALVHPSNADIRFVGFDNSTDRIRILRTDSGTNTSGQLDLTLRFGNVSEKQNLTYTAAFGIVNEESFPVNITNVYVKEGAYTDYLVIYLHRNPNIKATDDGESVQIWDKGNAQGFTNQTTAWALAAGNGDPNDLNSTYTETSWDEQAYVRFTNDTSAWATNGSHDFVWVQISINVPDGALLNSVAGSIIFYFEADTHQESAGGGGEPQMYEYFYPTGTSSYSFYGANWVAQTFTVGTVGTNEDHDITSVKLKLYRIGSPGTITVSIRAVDGDGKPTGSDLSTGTTNGNTLTTSTSGEVREITLSSYTLSASTKYAIVARLSGGNPSNYVRGIRGFSYGGGEGMKSTDSGSSWTPESRDYWFEEWGIPS